MTGSDFCGKTSEDTVITWLAMDRKPLYPGESHHVTQPECNKYSKYIKIHLLNRTDTHTYIYI